MFLDRFRSLQVLALAALPLLAVPAAAIDPADCAAPVQLTDDSVVDIDPAWDPAGETIAFLHLNSDSFYDLYSIQSDGSGFGLLAEIELPLGQACPFDLGWQPNWVGSTGSLMTVERCSFWEYLELDTSQAPFTRVISNGDDAAFTLKMSVPGGTGGDGLGISRDGGTAVWTHSGGFLSQVRTGDYATLAGNTDSHGTQLLSDSDPARYAGGPIAVSPDGSQFVIRDESGFASFDLFLYATDGSGLIRQLTTQGGAGATVLHPDVSPDGTKVAFAADIDAVGGLLDIYEIDIDGTNLVNLTNSSTLSEANPSYAPDGSRLVFEATDTGDPDPQEIYLLDCRVPFDLTVAGTCPGDLTINVSNATPDEPVLFIWGTTAGSLNIPPGAPCEGTEIGLADPRLLAPLSADTNGEIELMPPLPAQACGVLVQAIDEASCATSPVVMIPDAD